MLILPAVCASVALVLGGFDASARKPFDIEAMPPVDRPVTSRSVLPYRRSKCMQ
jgi:hypothetical protein